MSPDRIIVGATTITAVTIASTGHPWCALLAFVTGIIAISNVQIDFD